MSQIEPQRCVRHPDRTTYLACTRCGQPACPECLIPAAVGFHCVDCVASQPKPRGRTTLGFRGTDGNPRVTKAIIGLCLVAYVAQTALPGFAANFWLIGLARSGNSLVGVAMGEWWRLITVGFLHASLLHIFFNMYALWLLGPNLERGFGHPRFTALYLTALVGGSTASYYFNAYNTPAVGASGAIFGLFGALVVMARRLGRDASGIYGVIALNLVIGFVVPQIDWHAHLGGLVVGALAAYLLDGQRKKAMQVMGMLAIWAGLLGIVVIRTSELRALIGY